MAKKRKPPSVRRREVLERVRLATVGLGLYKVSADGVDLSITGTGFFIDSPTGVIVTASHVVDGIRARTEKEEWAEHRPGVLIAGSQDGTTFHGRMAPILHAEGNSGHDVAAIVTAKDVVPPASLRLSYSMAPREGFMASTCGWPHGFAPGWRSVSTFLTGPISSVLPWPTVTASDRDAYILQMPVTQGNSGGAVFDPDTGNVFAVVREKIAIDQYSTGLTKAQPVRYVRDFVERVARAASALTSERD